MDAAVAPEIGVGGLLRPFLLGLAGRPLKLLNPRLQEERFGVLLTDNF